MVIMCVVIFILCFLSLFFIFIKAEVVYMGENKKTINKKHLILETVLLMLAPLLWPLFIVIYFLITILLNCKNNLQGDLNGR